MTKMYQGFQIPSILAQNYSDSFPNVVKAKGIYLYDENNKEYLDFGGATACVNSVGFDNEHVLNGIKDQLSEINIYPCHVFNNDATENFLEKIVSFAGDNFSSAFPTTGGTESVEHAIKLCFQYHKVKNNQVRPIILSRKSSYHGTSIFALSVSGIKVRTDYFKELFIEQPKLSPNYSYRREDGITLEEYENLLIQEFEAKLNQYGPEKIACFIAEPISGSSLGACPPTQNYFKRISKICNQHDILMISDEVMTGFGRTGKNFGYEHFDFLPDILTCAKSISSGIVPLGAVIISKKVTNALKEEKVLYNSSQTFSFHGLTARCGLETVKYIQEQNLVKLSSELGEFFKNYLTENLKTNNIIGDIRGKGFFVGIEMVKNKITKEPFQKEEKMYQNLLKNCFKQGLIIFGSQGCADGINGDLVLLSPPLITKKDELIKAADIFINEVKKLEQNAKL